MADIFISYKKTDYEAVAPIVAALEAAGLSCWIDRRLEAGDIWDAVIERELNAAECVVVFWSSNSVSSHWVRTEAMEGLERGILVPVILDGAQPPLAFKLVQALDLTSWNGNACDARIAQLIAKVSTVTSAFRPKPSPRPNIRKKLNTPAMRIAWNISKISGIASIVALVAIPVSEKYSSSDGMSNFLGVIFIALMIVWFISYMVKEILGDETDGS